MPLRSLTTAAPQVIPAPKPQRTAVDPSLILPCSTPSTRAIGIDAAEVFP